MNPMRIHCIVSSTISISCVLFNFVFYIILGKFHFNPPSCFNTHLNSLSSMVERGREQKYKISLLLALMCY